MALGSYIANGVSAGSPSGPQGLTQPRAAMLFTSKFRQRAASTARLAAAGISESQARSDFSTEALAFFGNAQSFMPSIAMAVNPGSIRFKQPKRFSKKDTREGSVFFHFTNSKGQNNDILTIECNGSTGNLDLRGSLGDQNQKPVTFQQETANATTGKTGANDTGALYKLLAWHNLYLMTREPMLMSDGSENIFSIVYASTLFQPEITFRGFFSKVLEFEESGTKPNSRDYSFEFTVTSTIPDLDTVLQQISSLLIAPPTTPVFTLDNTGTAVSRPGETDLGLNPEVPQVGGTIA